MKRVLSAGRSAYMKLNLLWKVAVVEISILIWFLTLLRVVEFKNYYTPFVLSFVLMNSIMLLFLVFRKLYRSEQSALKKLLYDLINLSYSFTLSFSLSEVILRITYFHSRRLDVNDAFWLLTVFLSISIASYLSALKEKLRRLSLEKELQNLNMDLLRTKLNPHFVFNTFNFLAEAVRKNPDRAEEFTIMVSDYYRSVLKFKRQWSIDEELAFIEQYVLIQKEMMSSLTFDYAINIEDSAKKRIVPSGITQPVVENAIKYGIKGNSGGKLEINVCEQEDTLEIIIKNTGTPKREITPENFGTGLSIVLKQLELIGGKIFAKTDGNSTCVSLLIPLSKGSELNV